MSNNSSFGGKLRKVLASMCSLFVVCASGVSQADQPGTNMPTKLRFGGGAEFFGFGDFGWRNLPTEYGIKKEDSWLSSVGARRIYRFDTDKDIRVGFSCGEGGRCTFGVWCFDSQVCSVHIPAGVLFDAMRYFEGKCFRDWPVKSQVKLLSCFGEKCNDTQLELFLRFILWAFCGSPDTMVPLSRYGIGRFEAAFLEFAVSTDDPNGAGDKFNKFKVGFEEKVSEKEVEKVVKELAVLKPGYFLENFNKRVHDVYKDLGCDMTNINSMVDCIAQLNLENQKHIRKYLFGALGAFVGGCALTEGAHRFLGAKMSRSSEVNKGKPSSNKKGGQKAKKELKKRRG